MQPTGAFEETIAEGIEMAPSPQDSNVGSLVSPLEQSAQTGAENLASADTIIDSDNLSDFILFGTSIHFYSSALLCLYLNA